MAATTSSLQIKFLLVLTCMVCLHIVESLEPIPGQPLLQFSPDQAYKQKFLLDYWKDCHDAWLHTGGCLVDILKLFHGGGGLPGAGGLPLGDPPATGSSPATPPSGGSPTAGTLLDVKDAAAGGSGFPDIGSWFPGIGGGLPGLGGGIPGIGGIGGGLPGFGGPFSQVCCDGLAGVQKSCPGLAINPFYGPLVTKHCAAH